MRRSGFALALLLLVVVICLAGCAAGPNVLKNSPDHNGSVAGFWLGLWHGMILPITFLISLFTNNVTIYAVHNSGGWYDFGFIFGAAIVWGSGGAAAKHRDG